MASIANWPTVSVGISMLSCTSSGTMIASAPNNSALLPVFTEVGSRCRAATFTRGKQYELDQARSQINTVTLDNRDGLFDQNNPNSMYYPQITTHRQVNLRAFLPSQNTNLLSQQQASCGDAYGSTAEFLFQTGTTTLSVTTTLANVLQGSYALDTFYPASAPIGTRLWITGYGNAAPGTQYTFSAYMSTFTGTQAVALTAVCYNSGATPLSTTNGTAATVSTSWTRASVTFTPPAGTIAVAFYPALTVANGGTTNHIFTDQLQLEVGSSPSTWVIPNIPRRLGAGYIESVKHYVDQNSRRALVDLTLDDPIAVLSQTLLMSVVGNEYQILGPTAYYTLGDAKGAPSAGSTMSTLSGQVAPAAPVVKYGNGSGATFGNTSIIPMCPNDTCLSFDNTAVPAVSWSTVQLTGSSGVGSKFNTTGGACAVAFWFSTTKSGVQYIFSQQSVQGQFTDITIRLNASNQLQLDVGNVPGASSVDSIISSNAVNDGNVHFVVAEVYSGNAFMLLYLDGQLVGNISRTGSAPALGSVPVIGNIGNVIDGSFPFVGSIQHFAFFNSAGASVTLNTANVVSMYTAGINGFYNELSSDRFGRIMNYSQTNIPATLPPLSGYQRVSGLNDCAGSSVIEALNLNVQDEQSNIFVTGEGFLQMEARHDRWRHVTADWVIGDSTGEIPYTTAYNTELDDIRVVNYVTANRSNGATQTYGDPTSVKNHFFRAYPGTLTLKAVNDNDADAILQGIVWRFKDPMERVAEVTFDPSSVQINTTNHWLFALGATIGDRVLYHRKPYGNGGIQRALDAWIESVSHKLLIDDTSANSSYWTVTFEMGIGLPGNPTQGLSAQAQLATAARTTLQTATAVNATSFVLNPLSDSATVASQQDGWTPTSIQKITIWDGTNTETLTVSTISTTSPGYTSFTVTTTTGAAFAHSSGVTISEALPTGANSIWTYSTFDVAATTDSTINVIAY